MIGLEIWNKDLDGVFGLGNGEWGKGMGLRIGDWYWG